LELARFFVTEQWWKHVSEKVLDNSEWKILWDFTIQTGNPLSHNRPDITFVNKSKADTKFIHIEFSGLSEVCGEERQVL